MRRLLILSFLAGCLLVLSLRNPAKAADWGHLSGQVVFDGPAPVQKLLDINKDVEFCMLTPPRDESVVVHPKNGGLANVAIWLEVKTDSPLAIHPSYDALALREVRAINKSCRFEPRITVLWTKQQLVLVNDDDVPHNMLANLSFNDPFNIILSGKDSSKAPPLRRTERLPREISCSIHSWMRGQLILKDHPYVAVTDADGKFSIAQLPAGERSFVFWHEQVGFLNDVTIGGKASKLEKAAKGNRVFTINNGPNDLGQIRIAPAALGH